ncbi:MAG: SpoIIE family protein phosphatase [Acidobacteria bacterium]|nr:SpoIIE family protein phosphatase [Acidobacteriota bacterium]
MRTITDQAPSIDKPGSRADLPVSSRPSPKILIVDDTPTNVELLDNVLRAEGFRTISAADGSSARALGRVEQPDLILLDVMMPGESGFETCSRLKSDPNTSDIPIIFLSALDDVKNKVTGLKIGGVDYISKPVHGEEVLARVRVHLRISENNRALVREHRARLESLREAQQAILVRPEDCPEASFAVYYNPLEETGGDFYDVVAVDADVFGYFVADVSGHGASAAFLTSAIKALLRQYAGPLYSPEDTMRGVDAVMRQMLGEEQYLTACYAHLNRRTRKLSVVSAGHPPLVLVSATGQTTVVEMNSDPLGIFSSVVLQRKDLRVAPGDRFYLYSDGMIESSPGAPRKAGIEKLVASCAQHRSEALATATENIAAQVLAGTGAASDDLLLLAVEVSS